jgi:hypothetical protein
MDCDDIIGFLCFTAFETDGTFLISSIVDELVTSHDYPETKFMKNYKVDVFIKQYSKAEGKVWVMNK